MEAGHRSQQRIKGDGKGGGGGGQHPWIDSNTSVVGGAGEGRGGQGQRAFGRGTPWHVRAPSSHYQGTAAPKPFLVSVTELVP